MYKFILAIVSLLYSFSVTADQFIGQWHLFEGDGKHIARTIDGKHSLQIEITQTNLIKIKITLNSFSGFGTENNWFEYSSPTYGRIRTADFVITNQQVIISTPYEVNRFIDNLKDIASHPLFLDNSLGNSFSERKIKISYLANFDDKHLTTATFSTVEIDEVLEHLLSMK